MDSNINNVFSNFVSKNTQPIQSPVIANSTISQKQEINDTFELSNKKSDKNKTLTFSLIGAAILSLAGTAVWYVKNRNNGKKPESPPPKDPQAGGGEIDPQPPKVPVTGEGETNPKPPKVPETGEGEVGSQSPEVPLVGEGETGKLSLEEELENINKITDENEKIAKLAEYNEKIKGIIQALDIKRLHKRWSDLDNIKGLGRLAGYTPEKKILIDQVCVPIANEKHGKAVNIPAGVLLYGPMGTGKTIFPEALAGQADCHYEPVSIADTPEQIFDKIEEEAANAKKRFEQEGKRTIIHIDEIEVIARHPDMANNLKDFMETSSEESHCTIFGTTNYPDRIDEAFLGHGKLLKIPIPPADKESAAAILKHFAETAGTTGEVKYDEIAEHIVKHQPEEAFCNARIEGTVKEVAMAVTKLGKKICHTDLLEAFKAAEPDISKKALELFAENIKLLK